MADKSVDTAEVISVFFDDHKDDVACPTVVEPVPKSAPVAEVTSNG